MTAAPRGLGRRSLLQGAALVVAGCGAEARSRAVPHGPRLVYGSFRSRHLGGRAAGFGIAYPPGHAPGDHLPVVVSLHGRGGTHLTGFTQLRFDRVLDRVVRDGVRPFAVATVDGGDHGYWHRRADGTDAGALVAAEFLPLLAGRGLDTTRLGLQGWSMGGYGALLLASRRAVTPRAVAVSSPALFTSAGATPAGAFDDADDYRRHDVFGHPELLRGIPLRIDCGRQDPFHDATADFVTRLPGHPDAVTAFPQGAHTAGYWRALAPAAFRFLGERLHRG
jgi:S-formylglutathione hydrolase FrmB